MKTSSVSEVRGLDQTSYSCIHALLTVPWTNNTILIMTSSTRTCSQLRELLTSMHEGRGVRLFVPEGEEEDETENSPGKQMLQRMLKNYFYWKKGLGGMSAVKPQPAAGDAGATNGQEQVNKDKPAEGQMSEALKRKDIQRGTGPPGKRRRMRGGSTARGSGSRGASGNQGDGLRQEAEDIAAL
jgi:DNA excision repair protein ERCC-4